MAEEENDRTILVNLEEESKVLPINGNTLETKRRIVFTLCLFALRYSLAAMFWDRTVREYEELLDAPADKLQQSVGDDCFLSYCAYYCSL